MKKQIPDFLQKNYAVLALAAGLIVLGACLALSWGNLSKKAKKTSVEAFPAGVESGYSPVVKIDIPPSDAIQAPSLTEPGFLLSEKRIFCKAGNTNEAKRACGMPFPAAKLDKDNPVCPYCRIRQPMSQKEVKLNKDANGNGIPDDWEKKYGIKPEDIEKDLDGDGFTVMEEFKAETAPDDKTSHPDYFDSLSLAGAVKKETMPLYCADANKMSRITRFNIYASSNDRSYGSYAEGEPISVSDKFGKKTPIGWSVTNYVERQVRRIVPGAMSNGKPVERIVTEASITFVRAKDGKRITVPVNGKRGKGFEFEKTVKLAFDRPKGFNGGAAEIVVTEGMEFTLYSEKFRVEKISEGSVTIANLTTGKKKEYK